VIELLRSQARGRTEWDWLSSRHSFSFGEYFDPARLGFRALRVLNEDVVRPGAGFGTHGHRDMEILTVVLEGALKHEDSTGGGGVIRPGEVQFLRAGTGVTHSELNASATEPVHFLQIWLLPDRRGLEPRYQERRYDPHGERRPLVLLASRDGRDGSIAVSQDVDLWLLRPGAGERRELPLGKGGHAWVQVARGSVELGGERLEAGDAAALSGESSLALTGGEPAEVLVFDLA
jgi:redox-sensitive bicupin YhaK (pirin superfamily)